MVSIVCVVVHPSRLAREGLRAILAKSRFDPVCTTSSAAESPCAWNETRPKWAVGKTGATARAPNDIAAPPSA
jgi:hypothetical protein